jgi:hypothetical protein
MEEILLADLSLPSHGETIIYLLNEYAKDAEVLNVEKSPRKSSIIDSIKS